MNFIDALILGVVEGLTEFLPVSSTGHLILVSELLKIPETEFLKTFEVAIQLGAILSVIALYGQRYLLDRAVVKRVGVAFLPTGLIGFFLYGMVKQWLGSPMTVVGALLIGGVLLIVFERWHTERPDALDTLGSLPYTTALWLGIFQSLALVPGVSRAGATIIGGLLLGLRRPAIVEFSFLLAVPTMLVATGYDVYKNAEVFASAEWHLLGVGFLVSFVVAILAIRFFVRFVQQHTFIGFGVYRIVLALAFFFFVLN